MSAELLCLFNAELENQDGSYRIEIPRREVELETIEAGEVYRTAIIKRFATESVEEPESNDQSPPVSEGEIREVEIESMGQKGDGIARVKRGFVVIVSDAEVGDQVSVRITEVRDNVAFAYPLVSET